VIVHHPEKQVFSCLLHWSCYAFFNLPGLREALPLILSNPIIHCSDIRVPLHPKLAYEPTSKNVPIVPGLLAAVPHVPLMKIAQRSVSCGLALAGVWRGAMVVNVGMRGNNRGEDTLVNIARREVCFTKVRCFVGVVELKFA
jgi:hypothetical protein